MSLRFQTMTSLTVEDLLAEAKSFGRFQVIVILCIFCTKSLAAWSILQMAFGGAEPDWWCLQNDSSLQDNATFKLCQDNCTKVFSSDMRTVVSEWGLVCSMSWVRDALTSLQMAGLLVGAAMSGQVADLLGRKWTTHVGLLLHLVLNLLAGFSSSWQMFAALRFLIGVLIGEILTIAYPYTMEFLGHKARSALPWVPAWPIGVALFALTAWRVADWAHLHFILAAMHVPFFLGIFIIPESLRWLVVRGRLHEAQQCLARVARINGVPMPPNALQRLTKISEDLQARARGSRQVTYLDLVRSWDVLKPTLLVSLSWFSLSVVYHGINYIARSLAGNLYLNIFLLTFVELLGGVPTIYLCNKVGRRWTCAVWFFLTSASCFAILFTSKFGYGETQAKAVVGLAMLSKVGAGAAWLAHQTFVTETYPTSVRALGYGAACIAARIGGIVAPFVVNMDTDVRVIISYAVAGTLMTLSAVSSLLMEETKGKALKDTLTSNLDPTSRKGESIPCVDLVSDADGKDATSDPSVDRDTAKIAKC